MIMSYSEFVKRTLTVFAIIILLLALWHLRTIFMIGFLSAIIAVSLSLPVNKLQSWGVSRALSIAITLIMVLVSVILFVAWILPVMVVQMVELVDELPQASQQVISSYENWRASGGSGFGSFLPQIDEDTLEDALGFGSGRQLISVQDLTGFALPVLADAGNLLLTALANLAIVLIVAIFLLVDPMDYARGFISIIPMKYRPRLLEIMVELRRTVTTWMTAQTLSVSITIFLVWLILGILLGVPNALALGVIAGIMTFIPNIGALIPIIPITIFTLADNPARLPLVLLAYFLIQQLESNFITPSIVKRELNIPAGLLLLFQLAAATLFGLLGVLLAVPLLAISITLVRELWVYDVLGLRGVQVDIRETRTGLKMIVEVPEENDEAEMEARIVDALDDATDAGGPLPNT